MHAPNLQSKLFFHIKKVIHRMIKRITVRPMKLYTESASSLPVLEKMCASVRPCSYVVLVVVTLDFLC